VVDQYKGLFSKTYGAHCPLKNELVDSETWLIMIWEAYGRSIKPENDFSFTLLGLQTLVWPLFHSLRWHPFLNYHKHFTWCAMGSGHQWNRFVKPAAIEFYNLLFFVIFDFIEFTRTLFNSGSLRHIVVLLPWSTRAGMTWAHLYAMVIRSPCCLICWAVWG